MFQGKLQAKSQLVLKRLVACIYLWTALNKTILFSIFKLKLPHRIISILNGWKHSNCVIKNLPLHCKLSTMKEVVDGVLYHATQIT